MPLIISGLIALVSTAGLAVKTLFDETQETAVVAEKTIASTGPNILMIAAGLLGMYAAFQVINGKLRV